METCSYLSFELGKEYFASSVSNVINIVDLLQITKVPNAPRHMMGVINLRGDVLPLIDTRIKLGVEESEFCNETCILVLNVVQDGESVHVGAIVDSVHEVFDVTDETILKPTSVGTTVKYNYITGMVENNGNFIMILDMDKLFAFN